MAIQEGRQACLRPAVYARVHGGWGHETGGRMGVVMALIDEGILSGILSWTLPRVGG